MKHKLKIAVILGIEFIAIAIVLILIFFSGKKQYTVTFDLNGGTLVSGSLEQSVTQGHNATPPSAVKEGHYLRGWSGSYKGVTNDTTVRAIWEYETTPGIIYETPKGATYTEISGCYKNLSGKLYIGAYKDDLIVFGIKAGAFENCAKITDIHLLNGILTIEERAFAGCTSMVSIDLPNTATVIGDEAFLNCASLKSITLPKNLETLGANAFSGCTSLEEVYIPSTIKEISDNAFEGLENLKKVVFFDNEERIEVPADDAKDDDKKDSDKKEDDKNDEIVLELKDREPTVIGHRAFADCIALESVEFTNAPLVIKGEAFASCEALRYIIIPEKTVLIEAGAFDTPEMDVYLYFETEADIADFEDGWHRDDANLIFGYNGEEIVPDEEIGGDEAGGSDDELTDSDAGIADQE